jgi:hypothetical protein
MHSKKSTSLGLLLIVLVGSVEGTYAQIDKPVNLAFEKQLSGWLKETNVPAAGIAIIENGKLTYTKVFGELRKGDPTPAEFNLSSRFPHEAHRRDSHAEVGDEWKVEPGRAAGKLLGRS